MLDTNCNVKLQNTKEKLIDQSNVKLMNGIEVTAVDPPGTLSLSEL